MKAFKIFSTAALALMMAACSSDDIAQNNSPAQQQGRKVQFTAIIAAPNSGAGTRTEYTEVTSGDAAGTINVAWKANDEIALIHNGTKDVVKVETVNTDGSATITGTITVGTDNEKVEVCYPAALWEWDNTTSGAIRNADFVANITAQDGTLKYIQDKLDVRMGEGKLKVSGEKATLSANVTLASQIAIWKLTMQDNATPTPAALKATQVIVQVGDPTATVARTATLGTATSTLYLGLDLLNSEKVTIEATVGSETYKYEKAGVSIARGKYYQSTVTMKKALTYPIALSAVTSDYIGSVVTTDGNVYATIADATAASKTAVAMIAYKSETAGESLAIQLNASPESKNWNDAKTYASGLTAVPGGTWRLPSKADWQNMFVGCAKSGDAGAGNTMKPIAGFNEKIGATGITWKKGYYWSSTDSGSNACWVYVGPNAFFNVGGTSNPYLVLGCLAF